MFIIPILFSIVILISIVYYSRQIIFPTVYDHEETQKFDLERAAYPEDLLDQYDPESIEFYSEYDYKLVGELVLQDTAKFVIMCHGITSNYSGMKKYAKMFLDENYSILFYDHRNHGKSDRNFTSLGYFEKFDARAAHDYLIERFNPEIVGVFGESMGASTAMQFAAIDHRIQFCIEDCGYSNAYELMRYRATHDHNAILALLTKPTTWYLKMFYKWRFEDVSSQNYLHEIQCPVMFIHGDLDDYVPYFMLDELYNAFEGPKEKLVIQGARHAEAIVKNRIQYEMAVKSFLSKYVNK